MTLVDAATGEVIAACTPDEARRITEQIKVTVEGAWLLIKQAYETRAWSALGYGSWDDYCTREFGQARLRLPREERQEVVMSLRDAGLSIRAIAAATGISDQTVQRDLTCGESLHVEDEPEVGPKPITGTDGKKYTMRPATPEDKPRNMPLQERAEQIRALAAKNFTSPQIADKIGVSAQQVRDIARRTDVDVTADAVFGGKFRKKDPNDILDRLTADIEIPDTVLAFIEYQALEHDRIEGWVSSLSDAIRSLQTIKRNLQKELTRDSQE